ncbi:MAG: hypothetical protein ACAH22_13300, partial [Tardiphaga sp.]
RPAWMSLGAARCLGRRRLRMAQGYWASKQWAARGIFASERLKQRHQDRRIVEYQVRRWCFPNMWRKGRGM